jgi:hypothetical protein
MNRVMTAAGCRHGSVWRAVAAGCAIVAAACVTACQADRPPDVPHAPPAAAASTWREIGHWSGRLSQQTESFEVSTTPMRLHWQTTGEASPGAGRLTVTLHSAVSGRPLQTIVEARGVASGIAMVADEPRWCHLVIEATDVQWKASLERPQ